LPADLAIRSVAAAPTSQAHELGERALNVRKAPDAAEKFEAFVLQSFIQEMMPDQAEGVFGAGISGDFWKSMMSEKIAEQVAARGGIGLAETVRQGHADLSSRPVGGASAGVVSHLATMSGLSSGEGGAETSREVSSW